MYLIMRDLLKDLNAVGGGFMSQLEWGSDLRGIPLPVADAMESFFNSTFDHNGRKVPMPFATEADVQGLLTMLFFTGPHRRQPAAVHGLPQGVGEVGDRGAGGEARGQAARRTSCGRRRASWTATTPAARRLTGRRSRARASRRSWRGVSMPLADEDYFPGMGNSVTFVSPGGLEGIAGRLAYSSLSDLFSLSLGRGHDRRGARASSPRRCADLPTPHWPHTFVVPKYATMYEYKHYPPANHLHMIQGLSPARLEYWMDLNNVLSAAAGPRARPSSRASTGRSRCCTWRTAARTTRS